MPLILPLALAPGRKLQKPSKESGMFQSLDTISFVLFSLKGTVKKGGRMAQWPPSEYALGHKHIGLIFLKHFFFIYNISFFR